MTTNAPSGPPTVGQVPVGAKLVPIDFGSAHECQILYDQRVVCGWNQDKIPKWAASMAQGDRTFFWISLSPSQPETQPAPPTITRHGTELVPAGHVSLDKVDLHGPDVAPDTTLADPIRGVLTITSLFVLPAYNRIGLGAFAMDECERLARVPPYGSADCVGVTVNTLSGRYCIGGMPGPDGLGMWEREGITRLPRDMAPWYEKRGYKKYKEEIRYFGKDLKGDKTSWYASFLRKEF